MNDTQTNLDQEPKTVNVLDIKSLDDSLNIIIESLEKTCKSGELTLNEAYLLKLASNNLKKCILTLDNYQKIFIEMTKKNKEQKIQDINDNVNV